MRIALLDDYLAVGTRFADWSVLPAGTTVDAFTEHIAAQSELVSQLESYDVIVAMRDRTRFPAAVLERLPNLRLLVSTGRRNAAIDAEACARRGIAVCGAPGSEAGATAEVAWALILALAKRLPQAARSMRAGGWQVALTDSVEGKTLGVLGVGRLGKRVAKFGHAFGMNVIAWSPNLTDERAAEVGVRRVTKDRLLADSDFLSLHLVLSDATRGIIGTREIAAMKRSAYLINTSRAGLVDEQALLNALHKRRIAGAGLDVFWTEPLPAEHPLRELDNVVLTPHHGFLVEENMRAYYANALENIRNWIAGQPLTPFRSR